MRRALSIAAALVCLLAGVALLLLAVDVKRVQDALRADDVRYRVTPSARLWAPTQLVPLASAERLLSVRDDVGYRSALRAVRLSHPESPGFSDPTFVASRNEATARLVDIVHGRNDAVRRSAAANLLGILSYTDSLSDYTNRVKLLGSASGRFRQAIALDPANEDAKHNLELTLSRRRGIEFSEGGGGTNPTPGGTGAKGAGAGDPGSGY